MNLLEINKNKKCSRSFARINDHVYQFHDCLVLNDHSKSHKEVDHGTKLSSQMNKMVSVPTEVVQMEFTPQSGLSK